MTALLTLRYPLPESAVAAAPWELDAVPYVFSEPARVQFGAMPGIRWVRDSRSPNGRGFYRGPAEAIELVAATLESAGVCRVEPYEPRSSRDDGLTRSFPEAFERLRPYQQEGVSWLCGTLPTTHGALLADEMGLGKTPQAIVALDALLEPAAPRLVVCPAVVVPHWGTELQRWGVEPGSWSVCSYEGRAAHERTWRIPMAPEPGWAAIVCDEIHYISNAPKAAGSKAKGSQRSGALAAVAALHPKALRLGLSGTPMTTRPRDLHNPLNWLHPGRWGKPFEFQRRYCDGRFEEIRDSRGCRVERDGEPLKPAWQADGVSRTGELSSRLARVMLRRTKAQVGAELPPLTRIIDEIALPAAQRRGLRQAAVAADWDGAGLHALRDALGAAEVHKLEAAEAIARDCLAAGARVLLLTTRKESAWKLGEALGCPAVTGDDAATSRRAIIADAPCAVATVYSVETGINLTGFDTIIFVGLDWVPSRILQAEARIHRIGQEQPCTIRYIVARGTLDEVIRERVIERLDAFAAITGEREGDAKGLGAALSGGNEDDLLAAVVAACKEQFR